MDKNSSRIPFVNLGAAFETNAVEILDLVREVGLSGHYILGDKVSAFEKNFSTFIGTKHAVGVANGSDALFLIMKALGIGPGDEVVTQPNSFIASAWTIVAVGARPVFCDIDETLSLDYHKLPDVLTPRTKAIMPVHLAGNPANMSKLVSLAQNFGIPIIEDSAQAVGATYEGKKIGSFGIASMFSLHPLKNLGVMGDGGVITSNDSALVDKIKKLRNHGLVDRDHCELWGYNSRLDELQAGIATLRLRDLPGKTERIRGIANYYNQELGDLVKIPISFLGADSVFHNYIIHSDSRDSLRDYLDQNGIETKVHYPIPIHLQDCAQDLGYKKGDFPNAEYQSTNSLSLPIYPELSDTQVSSIVSEVKSFFRKGP